MDKNLEELKRGIDYVYEDTGFPREKKAAHAIADLWELLRDQGVEPREFAGAAVRVSGYVMTCFETLPEVLSFTMRMEAAAKSKLDTLKKHWPNIENDQAKWPKGLHPEDKE